MTSTDYQQEPNFIFFLGLMRPACSVAVKGCSVVNTHVHGDKKSRVLIVLLGIMVISGMHKCGSHCKNFCMPNVYHENNTVKHQQK